MKKLHHIYSVLLTVAVLLMLPSSKACAQHFSISNNLVYSATLTPNLGFAVRADSAWTVGISAGYRPWPTDDSRARKYRNISVALSARHWTKGNVWRGAYYGFDAMWLHYNLSNIDLQYFGMFRDARHNRIQGNLYGAGAFGGYAWDLGSGFSLEAQGGLDLSWTHYRLYDKVHCGNVIARRNRVYLLPKVALNICWRF